MGEAKRMTGIMAAHGMQRLPNGQIIVDPKNGVPQVCECGSKYFQNAFEVYTISALMSPIGKELTATKPVLICLKCQKVLKGESQEEGKGDGGKVIQTR